MRLSANMAGGAPDPMEEKGSDPTHLHGADLRSTMSQESSLTSEIGDLERHVPDERTMHRTGSSRSSTSTSSLSVQDAAANSQALEAKLAEAISEMAVMDERVLRTTPAYQAFRNWAAALRPLVDTDFFDKSCQSTKIQTFWSHSWHGGYVKKTLTLVVLYKGMPALVCGTLVALIMVPLHIVELLPGWQRWPAFPSMRFSVWCLSCGCLVALLAMVLWQPRRAVFLDRICISQDNAESKTLAIFSLAGFLKQSDEMLVLWDPSWTERLWCLFELAAFLKSRKGREQKLTVRPTFFGACSIVVFALVQAVCVPLIAAPIGGNPGDTTLLVEATFSVLGVVVYIVGQVAVKFMRNYFHSIETLKVQLRNISFDRTRSSCCDMNHEDGSGGRMVCDRVIVKRCACIWFGSEEAFEDSVRSTVLDTLTTELQFGVFSRTWTMGVAAPGFWTFLDLTASWSHHGANEAGEFLIEGLTIWLLALPALADLWMLLLWMSSTPRRTWFVEVLWNAVITMIASAGLLFLVVSWGVNRFVSGRQHEFLRGARLASAWLVVSICCYGFKRAVQKRSRQQRGSQASTEYLPPRDVQIETAPVGAYRDHRWIHCFPFSGVGVGAAS